MSEESSEDVRPVEPPPHDRFFEDGEEPPARYDLTDELDYILIADFPLTPRKWLQNAKRNHREFRRRSMVICLGFVLVWMIVSQPGICWIAVPLEPIMLAALTLRGINQLTGNSPVRKRRLYLREYVPLLLSNVIVLFATVIATSAGWFIITVAVDHFDTLGVLVVSAIVFAVTLLLFAVTCRLFRFVPYFVVDQEMGLLQAMRGSWRMWRGKFWAFLGLELLSFALQVLGALAFCIGLVIVKPFTTLFWTAAYLDAVRDPETPQLNSPGARTPPG